MKRKLWSLLCAVALLGTCLIFSLLGGPGSASAAPSAPALFDEMAEAEVPLNLEKTNDIAIDDKSGDLYAAVGGPYGDEVTKLSPYGDFILAFGKEVDETKVALRKQQEAKSETVTVTAQEEDLCTAASGDACSKTGTAGPRAGEFSGADGVAVEQSSGDVFVVDGSNHRVEKFDSSGHFQLAFGLDVNKAKAAALASPPSAAEQAGADLCVAGEECQAGKASSAEGAFESLAARPAESGTAKVIATGGPSGKELVYVGDKGRIEVFTPTGAFVEQLSLSAISTTEKVTTIAADASGDVFFAYGKVKGVHVAEQNGAGELELTATVFDESSAGVEALGVGGQTLYVADSSPALRILAYETTNPDQPPVEFGGNELAFELDVDPISVRQVESSGVNGIAVNQAEAMAAAVKAPPTYKIEDPYDQRSWPTGYHSGIRLYGSLSAMEGAYGASPSLKPAIGRLAAAASVEASAAILEAQVNPELRATRYQFEYGESPCGSDTCAKAPAAPASIGSTVKNEHQVAVSVSGLEVNVPYHYRVTAENAAGVVESSEHVLRIGTSQLWGPAIGLPDGRVYEQVSQPDKYGSSIETIARPAFVAPDGEAVLYTSSAAAAEASSSGMAASLVVSERERDGWVSRTALPLVPTGQKETEEYVTYQDLPKWVVPSDDLSRVLFNLEQLPPYAGPPDVKGLNNNIFLTNTSPAAEPEWVGRSQIEGQPGGVQWNGSAMQIAGASPDLKTIYFAYPGELLAGGSGLYEYREGVLYDAGVLPAGETASTTAAAAAQATLSPLPGGHSEFVPIATSVAGFDNQVSSDGSQIFFVRRDEDGIPELYVHITAVDGTQRSELVSQSQLPGQEGRPAVDGPYPMPSTFSEASLGTSPEHNNRSSAPSYVFASPDGSHAFFQSVDSLTEAAPDDGAVKTYDFDVETGGLEYVPAILGSIVTVSEDGSSAVFENTTKTPMTLERWASGPSGGTVTDIAELPIGNINSCVQLTCVGPVYLSADGSVVSFDTEAAIPGFNDGGTHFRLESFGQGGYEPKRVPEDGALPNNEVFRYDATTDDLSCLSCPPKGDAPTGNALMSQTAFDGNELKNDAGFHMDAPSNAMSADDSEVFFETPDALVPQDTNGTGDVYEWKQGTLYLISSGHDAEPSYLIGASESGEDVFFATAEGIASGDTDGGYDVYDARVPRPGDRPVEALPCEGAVCQGPPSVPDLLGQPASEAFSGPGNLTPMAPVKQSRSGKQSRKSKQQGHKKKRRARKACRRKGRKCRRHAHRRRSAKTARRHGQSSTRHHHNGRGK